MTNRILNSSNATLAVTNIGGADASVQAVPWIPITTADGSATGQLCVPVFLAGDNGSMTVNVTQTGAANVATGQVASSTTAGTLLAARTTRRGATFKNLDSSITVYIGPATVTAGNGMQLKAGESISVDTRALVQVIAASGTPTVAYIETYD